ncbi:hypothetical protein K1719_033172 [Acacia pycnantha]|nr:hypothetical protein K1719_033172 [Acacia pycnantha]
MARTGLFDLEKHFAFYGAYHSNPIFFSRSLILYFVPPFFDIPDFEFPSSVTTLFWFGILGLWLPWSMPSFTPVWIRKPVPWLLFSV